MATIDTIINNETITSSGSYTHIADDSNETVLFWNITGPITGSSPTIQFSLQELDPTDRITEIDTPVQSAIINSTGAGELVLTDHSSAIISVIWTVTGAGASFEGVYLSAITKQSARTIKVSDTFGNSADIKDSSTAAVATDKALVVAISPNNSLTVATLTPATATSSNISSAATNVTLLASNVSRKGATIFNDSTQILFVKLGTTASSTSFTVRLTPNGYYEIPFGYTGNIDGIWDSANGAARVVEFS